MKTSRSAQGPEARGPSGERRAPIEVAPDEVIQKDVRPWRRISLEGVVFRAIATSAAALLLLALVGAAIFSLLRSL